MIKGAPDPEQGSLVASADPAWWQSAPEPHGQLGVGVGVARGAAAALPFLPAVELAFEGLGSAAFAAQLEVASGRATGFRESAAFLGVGGFLARTRGRWRGTLGWRAALGGVVQTVDGDGGSHSTLAAATGPFATGALTVARGLALVVSGGVDIRWMRGDVAHLAPWPRLGLGLAFDL